jgi:hypothetical protein
VDGNGAGGNGAAPEEDSARSEDRPAEPV